MKDLYQRKSLLIAEAERLKALGSRSGAQAVYAEAADIERVIAEVLNALLNAELPGTAKTQLRSSPPRHHSGLCARKVRGRNGAVGASAGVRDRPGR